MFKQKTFIASVALLGSVLMVTGCASDADKKQIIPQISMEENIPLVERPEWSSSSIDFLDTDLWAVQDIKKQAMDELGEDVPQMYIAESKDGKCFIAYSITFVVNQPGFNKDIKDGVLTEENYKSLNLNGPGSTVEVEPVYIKSNFYNDPITMYETRFKQPIFEAPVEGEIQNTPKIIGTTKGVFVSRVFNVDVPNDSIKGGNLSDDVLERMTPAAVINYSCQSGDIDDKVLENILDNAVLNIKVSDSEKK